MSTSPTSPGTMSALRAHRRGGPETLAVEAAPRPGVSAGEVLLAVRAAGITFAELTWDLSWQTLEGADRTPVIPSHEVAGWVVEHHPSVTDLRVDDEVFGLVPFDRDGAAAEFVALPAEALAPAPKTVSGVAAAGLSLAALTAWQALVDHARITAGEHVLVHGGAGGVGVYAVQLAHILGARVTATASGEDDPLLQALGADRVIAYETESFTELVSDTDVVFDTVGGETLARSYGVLRPAGRLVTLGAPPSAEAAADAGIEATFFVVQPDRRQLTQIANLVDAGVLRAVVAATFPLSDGRVAYESGSRPRPPGKTVLTVEEVVT